MTDTATAHADTTFDQLAQRNAELELEKATLAEQKNAMAAKVERLLEAMARVADYWNGGEGLAAEDAAQHAQDVACDMLESIPADDSLARLKAQWQAEALQRLKDRYNEHEGRVSLFEIIDDELPYWGRQHEGGAT